MKGTALVALVVFTLGAASIVPVHEANAVFNFFGGHKKVKAVDGEILIPLAHFDDGKARHYQFTHGDTDIRFFVVKSSDGVIRAAFDACDVCFPARKGYSQDGDFMICNNCGRRFHSTRINVEQGGCNPAPLKREVVAGNLVLNVADIIPGTRFFEVN